MEQAQPPEAHYPGPGIYEHFKSSEEHPRNYIVFCTVKRKVYEPDSINPDEDIVVYASMYDMGSGANSPGIHWRSISEFMENVELEDGTKVPRFRFLGTGL
ncbi:MAG TPA: DUF1653 domain-containing protein [Candidatus Saccharimonadia bacterium]|nr:DUF1653 domain-containing protein [Candidatus Saccharimonadia bacterium]